MKIKNGVRLLGAKPELVIGLMVADSVYNNFGEQLVITSITDGKHGMNSLHFSGNAADLRINNLQTAHPQAIVAALADSLTDEFDVVLESDHIHMEYQPHD